METFLVLNMLYLKGFEAEQLQIYPVSSFKMQIYDMKWRKMAILLFERQNIGDIFAFKSKKIVIFSFLGLENLRSFRSFGLKICDLFVFFYSADFAIFSLLIFLPPHTPTRSQPEYPPPPFPL